MMNRTPDGKLKILVMREGAFWVAQCLDYDLAAQGDTLQDLYYQMERTIVGHIVASEMFNLEPFDWLPPAPEKFWKKYREGDALTPKTLPRFSVESQTAMLRTAGQPSISRPSIGEIHVAG